MKFLSCPVEIQADPPSTLAERAAQVPGMPINAMTAAVIDQLIGEAERAGVSGGAATELRLYRLQCCERGLHRHGAWQMAAGGGRFDQSTIYTGRVKTCVYCNGADVHETVYDDQTPRLIATPALRGIPIRVEGRP